MPYPSGVSPEFLEHKYSFNPKLLAAGHSLSFPQWPRHLGGTAFCTFCPEYGSSRTVHCMTIKISFKPSLDEEVNTRKPIKPVHFS